MGKEYPFFKTKPESMRRGLEARQGFDGGESAFPRYQDRLILCGLPPLSGRKGKTIFAFSEVKWNSD